MFLKRTLIVSAVLAAVFGGAAELKSPDAPFVEKTADLFTPDPVFLADRYVCGNKQIMWNNADNNIIYSRNEKKVFGVRSRISPSVPAWAPFKKFDIQYDEAAKTVTRTCPFTIKNGPKGTFRQVFRMLPDKRLEISSSFDAPHTDAKWRKVFSVSFPVSEAYGMKMESVGENGAIRKFTMPLKEKWGHKKKLWVNTYWFNTPKQMVFFPDVPHKRFVMEIEPGTLLRIVVFRSDSECVLNFEFKKDVGKPLVLRFDLGQDVRQTKKDFVFNGINFTKNNDFESPVYDAKGNYFLNPSFESKAHYYHNTMASEDVSKKIVSGGRTGKFAMKDGAMTFNFATLPGHTYTFSLYAKSADGKPASFAMSSRHCEFRVAQPQPKRFKVGKEWQRFGYTISNIKYRCVTLQFFGKNVLFDDLQFEEGKKATPYKGNPYGIELLTDSPDTACVNENDPINARVILRGPAGSKGKINIQVSDFFKRKNSDQTLPFEIPENGEVVLPIAEDSAFMKGPNAIRLYIQPEKGRPFLDFLRLSKFKYVEGKKKNAPLHSRTALGWPTPTLLTVGEHYHRVSKITGARPYVDPVGAWGSYFKPEISKGIADRYENNGFGLVSWVMGGNVGFANRHKICAIGDKTFTPSLKKMESYSPEVLKEVEEAAYLKARKFPRIRIWCSPNEAGGSWETVKKSKWSEYAKLMMAMQRGIRRANPENVFLAYSVCNLDAGGRSEVRKIFAEAKKIDPDFRFDSVDYHPYRPHPEAGDLDNDISTALKEIQELGYGKDFKLHFLEGAYFYPLIVEPWQTIAPWCDTLTKDGFLMQHTPSYDLGWGERAGAAMLLRYNLVCYKYRKNVELATSWGIYQLDEFNPWAAFVATSVQLDLLGDAEFRKDARFAPGARAYIFDDAHGSTVAAFWRFDELLDKGLVNGETMSIDLNGMDPEFIDMMGNYCTVPKKNGKYVLPLSNFPVYIRVNGDRADELYNAFNTSVVSGESLPIETAAKLVSASDIEVKVINPLTRSLDAELSVDGSPMQKIRLKPNQENTFKIKLARKISSNRINKIKLPITLKCEGKTNRNNISMAVVPVLYRKGKIEWDKIPGIPLEYTKLEMNAKMKDRKYNGKQDLSGIMKLAWNEESLTLRFEITDDRFALNTNRPVATWYDNDSIQIFFDNLGDARENFRRMKRGFDGNDSSYELLPKDANTCVVYRRHVPDHQLTGGIDGGLVANMIEPNVKCNFKAENGKRIYTVTFPKFYLQPMMLDPGHLPGIGIKVYDRDDAEARGAKQVLTNIPPGEGDAFQRPDLYTQLLFMKGSK